MQFNGKKNKRNSSEFMQSYEKISAGEKRRRAQTWQGTSAERTKEDGRGNKFPKRKL